MTLYEQLLSGALFRNEPPREIIDVEYEDLSDTLVNESDTALVIYDVDENDIIDESI